MKARADGSPWLDEIRTLVPERDHQRIVFLSTCLEFPFDTARALERVILRAFCLPSVARLLAAARGSAQSPQKRWDDADILASELLEWGHESERGGRALKRLAQIRSRAAIPDEDCVYVLSSLALEPTRWNARFGWRPFLEQERLAHFWFWRAVGRRAGIEGVPETYDALEQLNLKREIRGFRPSDATREVARATLDLFASCLPAPLKPVSGPLVRATLDPALAEACGLERPPLILRSLARASLGARARLLRWLPPRRTPRLRTEWRRASYPHGYLIEELGAGADGPGD